MILRTKTCPSITASDAVTGNTMMNVKNTYTDLDTTVKRCGMLTMIKGN